VAALSLTGCGARQERLPPPQPKLPADIASALAEQSDAVAAALDSGDACRALDQAERLQQESIAAINSRRVPALFQEPLTARVNELVARIECIPPPVNEDDEKHEDEGHGDGKGKGKGKKKGHG
jgi:hypothetical protein